MTVQTDFHNFPNINKLFLQLNTKLGIIVLNVLTNFVNIVFVVAYPFLYITSYFLDFKIHLKIRIEIENDFQLPLSKTYVTA